MSVFFVNSDNEVDVDSPAPVGSTSNASSNTVTEAQHALSLFWPRATEEIRKIGQLDIKTQALPLARIKKIMKLDQDVKMISAEAPMLFSKAAELFINELTLRAWVHTEDNKRRTLQRNDIAMAITKYDQFDFLIDIVPRDEVKSVPARSGTTEANRTSMNPDQVHYYFQLAQQHQAALQQTNAATTSSSNTAQTIQVIPTNGQLQTVTVTSNQPEQQLSAQTVNTATNVSQPQVIQLQAATDSSTTAATPAFQLVQQMVTQSGEVQQVPQITLNPAQYQMVRAQLQQQSGGNQQILLSGPLQTHGQAQILQVTQPQSGPTPVFLTQAVSNTSDD